MVSESKFLFANMSCNDRNIAIKCNFWHIFSEMCFPVLMVCASLLPSLMRVSASVMTVMKIFGGKFHKDKFMMQRIKIHLMYVLILINSPLRSTLFA